jgi:DNA integrity scanning protein DisA with diadenylate cyclase activity
MQEQPYLPDDERKPASQQLELNDFIDQQMDDNSAIEKILGTPAAEKIPTRRRK